MITLKNADAALKDYYLDAVSEQLNNNLSPFFSVIEKNSDYVSGKDVKLTVIGGHTGGVLAGEEDGELPSPHRNNYYSVTAPLKNIYGTIEISDKAIRASRDSSGAFVNLLNTEMEGLVKNAKENFQRMLFGKGDGFLCSVKSRKADSVFTVDKALAQFAGMLVDVRGADGEIVTGGEGLTLTAVDASAKTVTLSKDFATVTGYKIYVHGSFGSEITGLCALFENSELYGNDTSAKPYFKGKKLSMTSLTEEGLCNAIDLMEEQYDSKINFIYCSYATRRKIAALVKDNKRVVNSIDANTGIGVVTVNNIPVYADKYCADNVIILLNTQDFTLYQLCDWEWLEDEEGKILRQIPGKAAYTATLVKYAELVCRKPCGQLMIEGFAS